MNEKRKVQLLEWLKEKPQDSFLRFALAQEYQKAEMYDEAVEEYKTLMSHNPKYVGMYYHLGECLAKLTLEQEALDVYQKGMQVAQGLGDLHALSELKNAYTNLEMGLI